MTECRPVVDEGKAYSMNTDVKIRCLNVRDVKSAAARRSASKNTAIFELFRAFDHILLS